MITAAALGLGGLGGAYRGLANGGMRAQGAPEVAVDGEVLEADPPRKLVQTWRMAMDPALAAEGFTRLTYEIEPANGGVTKLTVTHDLTGVGCNLSRPLLSLTVTKVSDVRRIARVVDGLPFVGN